MPARTANAAATPGVAVSVSALSTRSAAATNASAWARRDRAGAGCSQPAWVPWSASARGLQGVTTPNDHDQVLIPRRQDGLPGASHPPEVLRPDRDHVGGVAGPALDTASQFRGAFRRIDGVGHHQEVDVAVLPTIPARCRPEHRNQARRLRPITNIASDPIEHI